MQYGILCLILIAPLDYYMSHHIRNLELNCSCCEFLAKSLQPPQNLHRPLKTCACVSLRYSKYSGEWVGIVILLCGKTFDNVCCNIENLIRNIKTFSCVSLWYRKRHGGWGGVGGLVVVVCGKICDLICDKLKIFKGLSKPLPVFILVTENIVGGSYKLWSNLWSNRNIAWISKPMLFWSCCPLRIPCQSWKTEVLFF